MIYTNIPFACHGFVLYIFCFLLIFSLQNVVKTTIKHRCQKICFYFCFARQSFAVFFSYLSMIFVWIMELFMMYCFAVDWIHTDTFVSITEYEKIIDESADGQERLNYTQPSTSSTSASSSNRRSVLDECHRFLESEHTTINTDPQTMHEKVKPPIKKFAQTQPDATNWEKFRLLTWKNFLLQWRRKLQTVIEILVPVLFSALLVFIRSLVIPEIYPNATVYQPFPIDNLDPLRWIYGFDLNMCNLFTSWWSVYIEWNVVVA